MPREPVTPKHTGYDTLAYWDEPDEATNAETTPSTRNRNSNTPPDAKARVDKLTTNTNRCLITNILAGNVVEYAHCFRRSFGVNTQAEKLLAIEYAWGLKRYTLNLDTRYNIFRLEPKMHRLFDKGLWLLLPDDAVIQKYHAVKDEPQRFPTILPDHDKMFGYRFLAHPEMKRIPIHRLSRNVDRTDPPMAADFDFFAFPYTNTGIIRSHVHPKYVICSIGSTLSLLSSTVLDYYRGNPDHQGRLEKIIAIYEAWTRDPNRDDPRFKAFLNSPPPNPDDEEDTSEYTGVHRALRPRKRTIYYGEQDDSPPQDSGSGNKRQKGGQHDSAWLDEETLRDFDENTSLGAMKARKRKAVEIWVTTIASEGDSDNDEHCMLKLRKLKSDESDMRDEPLPIVTEVGHL